MLSSQDILVLSNWADASFALDVGHQVGQKTDISDLISLKTFANDEFCPRFLVDEHDLGHIGHGLKGKRIYLISTSSPHHSRNELALRNMLISRAAKENGAERVVLIEPDLFFSAQDRGPHFLQHPQMQSLEARKKFDGQPFSAEWYAKMLHASGVDQVVTVHNHKPGILQQIYATIYQNHAEYTPFINLDISHIVAQFILQTASRKNQGKQVCFVAPDQGASKFVHRVRQATGLTQSGIVVLQKTRLGQRLVALNAPSDLNLLKDRQVFILDDMVRTGGTIASAISLLAENPEGRPESIYFYCTHTYISPEGRENLNSSYLTEFVTTNTMPNVLNRDDQGRLRKKMTVMKIECWIADAIIHCLERGDLPSERYRGSAALARAARHYKLDFSSRNVKRNPPDDQLSLPELDGK